MAANPFIGFLERWIVPLTGRRRATLSRQVDELMARAGDTPTRDELDNWKSSLEVDPRLVDEYLEWKRSTPVPAEPLVSVCMATYNRARLLTERSIPSILTQTYRNLEVIVVGDACTDDTAERVRALGDARVTFINLERRGQYPAHPKLRWMVAGTDPINHALRQAKGDYVTHLDDDDEYVPERIGKLVRFAQQTQCDFVWHPFWWELQPDQWVLNEAPSFAFRQVTTSSVFYRSWFTRIEWNRDAYLLREPGDWNRFRRIRYLEPDARRFPEPLLRHYRERVNPGVSP